MVSPLKTGFVGCGAFAAGTHLPNARANPGYEIVGLCDLGPERLKTLREQYRPRYVTQDMERLFADPDIEAIVCGTKPDFRLPIMKLAVKHRKHLFVEKPLCYREEEIAEMVALMRDAPIAFMVGFNRPYSPLMQALKPLYRKQKRGTATILYRIVGEGDLWPAGHKKAVYERKESTIIHEITHIFDLLDWLTELAPTRVYAAGGGNTDNAITLTYPDETTAVIVAGDNATAGYPKERIEVNTAFSTLIGEEFVSLEGFGVEGGRIRQQFPYKQESRTYTSGFPELVDRYWAWRASVTEAERAYGYYYDRQVRVDKGHYGELEHFRQRIRAGQRPDTGVVQGALANVIAWRAVKSWETGMPVAIEAPTLCG